MSKLVRTLHVAVATVKDTNIANTALTYIGNMFSSPVAPKRSNGNDPVINTTPAKPSTNNSLTKPSSNSNTKSATQGNGNNVNDELYKTSELYRHEVDSIAKIESINKTKFNWDINNFNKIYEGNKAIYVEISKKTDIPPELIAAKHYREGSCNFNTYLHNGQPLGKVTTIVPKGKYFENFTDAAVDALSEKNALRDKYKITSTSTDMAAMMAYAESYNGLGYYLYHKETVSPYVYSGTNIYIKGKYVEDGKYNGEAVDAQPGVYLLMKSLKK